MSTYRFRSVKARVTRRGKCQVCGRAVSRSKTFEQTVNPFNRGPDGVPLTEDEVRECVKDEAGAWIPDFTHDDCTSDCCGFCRSTTHPSMHISDIMSLPAETLRRACASVGECDRGTKHALANRLHRKGLLPDDINAQFGWRAARDLRSGAGGPR